MLIGHISYDIMSLDLFPDLNMVYCIKYSMHISWYCILYLVLDKSFYKCELGTVDWWCFSVSFFFICFSYYRENSAEVTIIIVSISFLYSMFWDFLDEDIFKIYLVLPSNWDNSFRTL